MLISHTLRYLPAQLVAPLAQLVSVILWTHWLAPVEMGLFTLVTVGQEIAYVLCLGWFSVYALRYLPAADDAAGRRRYLGTENVVVLASIGAGMLVAIVTALTLPRGDRFWLGVGVIGAYFVTRGINMHYAERARAQSAFVAYTLLQTAGPLGGLALALVAFQYLAPSAWVLLGAYATAQVLGAVLALPILGMHWRLARPDATLLRSAFGFGLPLLGLGLLGWAAENYIRYLVQWHAGAAALGLMIVGWSLGRRCAAVAGMLVATAAFPLASRLLNEGRRDEALAQLSVNAALMLAVLVPVTAALMLLGPSLVALTVAPEYRQTTAELLGLAVLGGALRNLHMHVTDQVMVLERRFRMVAEIDLVEIVACGAASFAGLLLYGLHGAVAGQAIGSLLTLALSMRWAGQRLGFAWPWRDTARVVGASALMAGVLYGVGVGPGVSGLIGAVLLGAAIYGVASGLLFAAPLRRLLAARHAGA